MRDFSETTELTFRSGSILNANGFEHAAKPTAAFDAKFGNFVIDPAFFTRLVYEGV